MVEYSVVIPVFSNRQVFKLVEQLKTELNSYAYELILVLDGIDLQIEKSPELIIISFNQNYGKNYALFEGIKAAKGKWVITMDDDGEHAPSSIRKLMQHQKHDVVIGTFQSKRRGESWFKHACERLFLSKPSTIRFTPFKLIRKSALKLALYEDRVPFIATLILRSTKDIKCIPVLSEKEQSPSSFNLKKRLNFFFQLVASCYPKIGNLLGVKRKKVEFKNY